MVINPGTLLPPAGFILTGAYFGEQAVHTIGDSLWESNNKGVRGRLLLPWLGWATGSSATKTQAVIVHIPCSLSAEAVQGHGGRQGGRGLDAPL